ncbi:hypothetical protein HNR25_002242 [Streptomonospora salina]|uniref:Uncharacterized protein n=1 Tax=Streptomonospora salina TaxID=104205 RepID=A0A841EGE4_9ACTN|nr:hypothetical protein [Streptomonospora salina]
MWCDPPAADGDRHQQRAREVYAQNPLRPSAAAYGDRHSA